MKKQIITVVSVALAAVLLFTAYSVFFDDDGIEEVGDPFYTLGTEVQSGLAAIEAETEIALVGYNSADDNWVMIYRFAESVVGSNREFSLTTAQSPDFSGVKVTSGGGSKEIAFDSFFKKLYDGTVYAFDGEALLANAILSLNGKEEMSISLRALDGFDIYGDYVTSSGAPFMFEAITRDEIAYLTVNNEHGEYSVYKDGDDHYFTSSRAAEYNDDAFSLLTTNCRYPVTSGKMEIPEGQTWASYGLDSKENATASYTILTTADSDGSYTVHTVYVGSKASSGAYYYARYVGGKFVGESSDAIINGAQEPTQVLSKDFIYFLPVSTVEASLMLPQTDIMKPSVVNAISGTEDLLKVDNVRIDYYDEGISALIKNFGSFIAADNLSVVDSSSLTTVIGDKKHASDYSSYEGGWNNNINVFGAFTSSDGKSTYIEASLARAAKNGEYKVQFGLLRDEANGAYLPEKFSLNVSYDGTNYHNVENVSIEPSQEDKTVKNYELTFTDEQTVKFIRLIFDVPKTARSYVVMDELRIFADGEDSQPVDVADDIWRLVAPVSVIPEGRNYTTVDMTNFSNFIQYLTALEGEKVVAVGFSENGDATPSLIKKDVLAPFGLDEPARHYGFEFEDVVCDIYVSAPDENGYYYAYSTYTGVVEGKSVIATSDVVVRLSLTTAEWLNWEFTEFLDHSLFAIFVADIEQFDISVDGTDYEFILTPDEAGSNLGSVSYQGKSMDVESFKNLYMSILEIYMQDEYTPAEGETAEEYLRVQIHSETNSPEVIFYRVSSSKCYFTVEGVGSYYALVEDVNIVRENVLTYVSGGKIS